MSSKIQELKELKYHYVQCKEWYELVGKPYIGGGGGIGKLHSITFDGGKFSPTVYHQAYNGATNYHQMPKELFPYFEQVIKNNFRDLFTKAMEMYSVDIEKCAVQAKREYEEIQESINEQN